MNPWVRLGAFVVAVLLAVVMAVRDGGFRAEGPLRIDGGFGSFEAVPPKAPRSWWLTFGTMLCSTDPHAEIELKGVRVGGPVAPLSTRAFLRTVPAFEVGADGPPARFAGIGALRGLPSAPGGRGVRARMAGRLTTTLAGTRITQPCADHREPNDGFSELLVAIRSAPGGAWVEDVWVDYEVNGRQETAHTTGAMIACGPGITEPGTCGSPDEFE